jgi:hypothetical protein
MPFCAHAQAYYFFAGAVASAPPRCGMGVAAVPSKRAPAAVFRCARSGFTSPFAYGCRVAGRLDGKRRANLRSHFCNFDRPSIAVCSRRPRNRSADRAPLVRFPVGCLRLATDSSSRSERHNRFQTGCSILQVIQKYADKYGACLTLRPFMATLWLQLSAIAMSDLAISPERFAPDLFGFNDVVLPRFQRARTTNNPLRRVRGVTADGRRIRDLFLSFMGALGNPRNAVVQARVLAAVQLVVKAEIEGAKIIAEDGDPNELVRLQNAADRAMRRLGLDRAPPAAKRKQTLADYARDRATANEGA